SSASSNSAFSSHQFLNSLSAVPRWVRSAPSASLTTPSLSATNKIRSPLATRSRSLSACLIASEKNFSIDPVNLSPSNFIHASPSALFCSAILGSSPPGRSLVFESSLAPPLAFSARTTPPDVTALQNTPKPDWLAMSETSTISSPNRRSGLSEPYFASTSAIVIRGHGDATCTPTHPSKNSTASASTVERTSSSSTNDISRSSWVNSGCRSARRSSSRRQRAIWKYLSYPETMRSCL